MMITKTDVDHDAMPERPFAFVIPAYNCGEYISEAIESVIDQSIGFEDNIQLVIVNDGSTDNTAEICEWYASAYPNNITYLQQENKGVAAARQAGFLHVKAEYVSFFDADDKWSSNVCDCVQSFLTENSGIEVITAKAAFFGRRTGSHPLAYKYSKDAVIDLYKVYDYPQLAVTHAFIRSDVVDLDYFDS